MRYFPEYGNQCDELNRLKQITDPASGATQFAYDAIDNLTSVTDPLGMVTSYQYNAFGDVKQLASPDTGTTTSAFDSGGNLATRTDARSKTGTYAYDVLNRATSITYPDQTLTFTYDAGTNAKGRLTGASDANHSLSWTYDAQGRLTGKGQTVGSINKSVGYGYSNGNLASIVTPSGQTITYGYTAGRITSVTLNGSTTILNQVLYEPFGPVRGWSWGNSTIAVRTHDLDGKPTALDSAGAYSYAYDDAFRITGIEDLTDSSKSWAYGYDALDRLNAASKTGLTIGYTYDANGNRLTQTGTSAATYTISSTSNRITSITGTPARTYSYDAAGNTTGYATLTFAYSDSGRLKSAATGGVTTSYVINALGQRVKKSSGTTTRYFVHDEAGHLLGEYDGAGALVQETIWLGDTPVATLRPNGSGGVNLLYVHTDHLDTPRRISRPGDNVIVWRWDSDPFGTSAANEDPDGDSTLFNYNLRFPGQYFDSETGLNYNYLRDYDPTTGRYVEADLLGLSGGMNLFAYAKQAPLQWFDRLGLVPGDAFTTRGAAAQDALNFINPSSISQNQEYIGLIYLDWNTGMYIATSPLPNGCQGSANKPLSFPKSGIPVGDYHTHGDYCDANCNRTPKSGDQNNSDNFSSPDIADGKSKAGPTKPFPGWMKYLGTPSGQFKQYTPGSSPQPLDPTK